MRTSLHLEYLLLEEFLVLLVFHFAEFDHKSDDADEHTMISLLKQALEGGREGIDKIRYFAEDLDST